MTTKLSFLPLFLMFFCFSVNAQDAVVDAAALKAQKAEKEAQIAALQGEVDALTGQIETLPGWKFGSLGTVGFNLSQFNDWLGAESPDVRTSSIGLAGSAFAKYDDPKQFWRNSGNLTFVRTKITPDPDIDKDLPEELQADFITTADAVNATSLYGYKLTEKWAISGLGEYRSTLKNFNDPGFLDLGIGATWTPITDMVVVFHPLNYNFVFSNDDAFKYESSLGCKIVADYSKALPMGIAWSTNLSAFVSYKDVNNFSNWTWTNGLSFTAWKGIGVGFNFGLRGNRQESYNTFLKGGEALGITSDNVSIDDFDGTNSSTLKGDNPLQSYWLLGLTYNL